MHTRISMYAYELFKHGKFSGIGKILSNVLQWKPPASTLISKTLLFSSFLLYLESFHEGRYSIKTLLGIHHLWHLTSDKTEQDGHILLQDGRIFIARRTYFFAGRTYFFLLSRGIFHTDKISSNFARDWFAGKSGTGTMGEKTGVWMQLCFCRPK